MNLIRRKNNDGFPSLLSEMLSGDVFDSDSNISSSQLGISVPSANISETSNVYKIELAAPGLDRKDLKIELENNILKISAEKEEEKKEDKGGFAKKEYSFNSFSRAFTLPDNIKEDNIEAKYENGILEVTIPKDKETPQNPTHKIDIK